MGSESESCRPKRGGALNGGLSPASLEGGPGGGSDSHLGSNNFGSSYGDLQTCAPTPLATSPFAAQSGAARQGSAHHRDAFSTAATVCRPAEAAAPRHGQLIRNLG